MGLERPRKDHDPNLKFVLVGPREKEESTWKKRLAAQNGSKPPRIQDRPTSKTKSSSETRVN